MKIDMIENLAPALHNGVLKASIGSLVGLFAYFFDVGLFPAMLALLTLSIMDLFTAFLARGENPIEPFSRPIRKTAHKIAGYFVSISSVFILAKIISSDIGVDITMIDNMLVWFFVIHEVISIIENLNTAGIPIPVPFLDKLKKVKEIIENK
jgi:phage-related holin